MQYDEMSLLIENDDKTPEEKLLLQQQSLSLQFKHENKSLLNQVKELESKNKSLEEDFLIVRNNLDEANTKYRVSMEQIGNFKERIAIEESAHKKVREELDKIQDELIMERERLEKEIEELRRKGEQKSDAFYNVEKELIRVQAELEGVKEQLTDANLKYRAAIEQITTLKEKVDFENNRYINALEQIGNFKERIAIEESAHKKVREELDKIQDELIMERERLEKEIEELRRKGEQKSDAFYNVEKELIRVQAELEGVKEQLTDANLKYRHQVNEVVPHLKNEIDRLKFQLKQTQANANHQAEQLKQKVAEAQQQVVKVRSTLSFQIGYQIVHGFKTWRGVLLLPWKIWKVRQEFRVRHPKTQSSSQVLVSKAPISIRKEILTESTMIQISSMQAEQVARELPKLLTELRVACIMDEFTYTSYAPECDLMQLTPDNWKSELVTFGPDILFIESAWRGKDDLWGSKVGHNAQELQGIVQYCKWNSIPTLFWNKEDPVHFETFLNTAQQFDYVFTTDIDCIHRYKGALGHDRVYLLPFATQPKVHNPIEKYERKDGFCFAGAYYVRYPERTKDLGNFVMHLSEKKPFEIYDRNYGKDDPNYMFPEEYKPFIVGTLAHHEIDKAYKGYNYAINLNSIKQSQSMFARRVFELLSSNTITISNFSRGVRLLFGDLVFTSDNSLELLKRLDAVTSNDLVLKKHRLAALRKVLQEHTYEDRLGYIVSKIRQQPFEKAMPAIGVLGYASNQEDLDLLIAMFNKQSYEAKKLYVICADDFDNNSSNVTLFSEAVYHDKNIGECILETWIASFSGKDYYGKNYLADLALSTSYSDASVIGKGSFYEYTDTCNIKNDGQQYKAVSSLKARSSLIKQHIIADKPIVTLAHQIDSQQFELENMLSVDEMNYCCDGMDNPEQASLVVDDLQTINLGIPIDTLLERAEAIEPLQELEDNAPSIEPSTLKDLFKSPANKSVEISYDGDIFAVQSHLSDGKHEYVYAREDYPLDQLGYKESVKFYLDTSLGLNIQLVIVFLDAHKQKISHVIKSANRNHEAVIPIGTEYIRFGFRIYAGGYSEIKSIVLGHRPTAPADVIGSGKHLVLTNHYPSYEDLYRNGFVHSRIVAYKESGMNVDVFRLRPEQEEISFHEFQNIDVLTGSKETLKKLISGSEYETILVHFLDEQMWEVISQFIDEIRVLVWVHGAEVQPWYRRDYNYRNDDERNDAKRKSDLRMAFWRKILKPISKNLKLIFVSKYFAEEVMEDIGFRIPKDHYTVIHNPIDTDLFSYKEKSIEQRKKILSIRPYASAKYANDLSVKTVLALKDKPYFNELEFHFIGDGILFDETLEPLRKFSNIKIDRGFLTQPEIASLHKQYGIFLCPTRMDAQGVSRDEAMSSGLVPITNAVAAIPEFVDDSCGILATGEDYVQMAKGIEKLFYDPSSFSQMSKNASIRVNIQSAKFHIILQEIQSFSKDQKWKCNEI